MQQKNIQFDNADTLPPSRGVADTPPWVQPAAPRHRSWQSTAVLAMTGLIGLGLVYLAMRDWIAYEWSYGTIGYLIKGLLAIVVTALGLKALVWASSIVQPGGYVLSLFHWFRADAAGWVSQQASANPIYAGRTFPNAAQVTFSPTQENAEPAGQIETLSMPALPAPDEPLTLDGALAAIPRLVRYADIADEQPSRMSVPLGIDQDGQVRWADMQRDMLHVGIFGGTGAGKDNLIENWFLRLATSNTPDLIRFAVLDGKGHWMQPKLADLDHMFIRPAGGIGAEGQAALRDALLEIQNEAQRRGRLVFGANCDNAESYMRKTGETLPYLFVIISDVMGNLSGDVDKLLVDLVSKARALGIRVIVSLQTPTKQNMQWRANLSSVFVGQMQGRSQDEPALGIAERDMLYRPSQLPTSKQRPGVFVVRFGAEQLLVQAPLMERGLFDGEIARLPVQLRSPARAASRLDDLATKARQRAEASSPDERQRIAATLARAGCSTRQVQYGAMIRMETAVAIWQRYRPDAPKIVA